MLNQVVLVGRLTSDLEIQETESGKRRTFLTLAVQRSFKNIEGEYDTDFIDVVMWDSIAENTVEYCRKGDVVGIKGRLQASTYKQTVDNYFRTLVNKGAYESNNLDQFNKMVEYYYYIMN